MMIIRAPFVLSGFCLICIFLGSYCKQLLMLADARTTVSSAAPPVTAMEDTVDVRALGDVIEEQKESTASAAQEVDLSDPDKYCKLCVASFNNPVMAGEHYNGRKHQRNLARQDLQSKLGEQSELGTLLSVVSLIAVDCINIIFYWSNKLVTK